MEYKRREVGIEAEQWDGTVRGLAPLVDFMNPERAVFVTSDSENDTQYALLYPKGEPSGLYIELKPGDYLVKGIDGTFEGRGWEKFQREYTRATPVTEARVSYPFVGFPAASGFMRFS